MGNTLGIDPSTEDVYVDSGNEVTQYGPSGELLGALGLAGGGTIGDSFGVAVNGASGDVYVSDNEDGRVNVFGPAVVVPGVSTGEPSSFTETSATEVSATLAGTVNPEGQLVTGCEFEYGVEESYGQTVPCASSPGSGSAPVAVSATVSGLEPLKRYHYRLVATNANGSSYGADSTFTVPVRAKVDGESVSDVAGESATFNAQINPGDGRTTYRFEYGTSLSYGSSVPVAGAEVGAGLGDVSVSMRVQGLLPDTVYHFRVVASNPLGAVSGPDGVFTTQSAGMELALPDGRQYELVSPPSKDGGEVVDMGGFSGGGVVQASEDGGAVTYLGSIPFDGSTLSNTNGTQYMSKREANGWSTQSIMPPTDGAVSVSVNDGGEYRAFSADLSRGVIEPQDVAKISRLPDEAPEYFEDEYLWSEGVPGFQPLVTSAAPDTASHSAIFRDGTPDLSHVLFSSLAALTPGAVQGVENLFEWADGGGLRLVDVLPKGEAATEAHLGAEGGNVRHAVSDDGSRVVFTDDIGGVTGLYERDTLSGETVQIAGPESYFQIASNNGLMVFFTHGSNGGDLHEFDAATGEVTDATPDGEAAEVQGVVGASEDASYVYFVARGSLAAGAVSGGDNLYSVHYDGTVWEPVKFIAALSSADAADWDTEYLPGLTARVSPNGRFLAFVSLASLTGYDNTDINSGQADAEVYLYDDKSGQMRCVSCNPTGARPAGELDDGELPIDLGGHSKWYGDWLAAMIPGWTPVSYSLGVATYQSRYLSDEGRLFFDSAEALVPQDTNGKEDVYEYEPEGVGSCHLSSGCVYLISGGIGSSDSVFVDASASGEDVFFLTKSRLVAQDVDDAQDMYDAHVCSAAAPCFATPPAAPPACTSSDACKPGPTPQSAGFGAPASATFSGLGNQPQSAGPAVKTSKPKKRKTKVKRRVKKPRHRARHAARAKRSRFAREPLVGRSEKGGSGHDARR